LYFSVAHRTGSIAAVNLAEQLSAWHDEMVVHARAVARIGEADCGESCPHARALELWRAAREVLGADADRLIFLRTTATESSESRPAARRSREADREMPGHAWREARSGRPEKADTHARDARHA